MVALAGLTTLMAWPRFCDTVGRCRFVEAPAELAMTGVTWSFMGCRTPLLGATLRWTTKPGELLGAGPLTTVNWLYCCGSLFGAGFKLVAVTEELTGASTLLTSSLWAAGWVLFETGLPKSLAFPELLL